MSHRILLNQVSHRTQNRTPESPLEGTLNPGGQSHEGLPLSRYGAEYFHLPLRRPRAQRTGTLHRQQKGRSARREITKASLKPRLSPRQWWDDPGPARAAAHPDRARSIATLCNPRSPSPNLTGCRRRTFLAIFGSLNNHLLFPHNLFLTKHHILLDF